MPEHLPSQIDVPSVASTKVHKRRTHSNWIILWIVLLILLVATGVTLAVWQPWKKKSSSK